MTDDNYSKFKLYRIGSKDVSREEFIKHLGINEFQFTRVYEQGLFKNPFVGLDFTH